MNADIHGLSGAYAVDALDDVERAEFERHLGQCPECQDEVASLRAAAVELSHASAASPPPSLRDSVLSQISTVRPLPPVTDRPESVAPAAVPPGAVPGQQLPSGVTSLESRRRRNPLGWLVAAAPAAVLVIGGIVWSPWDDGEQQRPITATEVVQAPDAQRYEKVIDGAKATIVRSVSLGKAVIIAENMPAAPDGKDFQLWFENPDGAMVNAGLMPHEAKPKVSMLLDGDASKFKGVGITVEPAGGSTAPTSAPIALIEFT